MMTLADACNVLHVDQGNNDFLINTLIEALPGYIEMSTGYPATQQVNEPLVPVVEGLLLTQWYYADHADDQALTRSINALLKVITLKAKEIENE